MDIRIGSGHSFVSQNIDERQMNLSRIFTSLQQRQRPEQPLESQEIFAFERAKRSRKVNAQAVQETQNLLQAFSEIRQNISHVLSLLSDMRSIALQRANTDLSSPDSLELEQQAIELQRALQSIKVNHNDFAQNAIAKFSPDSLFETPSGGHVLDTPQPLPISFERFELSFEGLDTLSFNGNHIQETQEKLVDYSEEMDSSLLYLDALEGRISTNIRLLDKKVKTPGPRIETLSEAKRRGKLVKEQIRKQASLAFFSQANIAYPDAIALLG